MAEHGSASLFLALPAEIFIVMKTVGGLSLSRDIMNLMLVNKQFYQRLNEDASFWRQILIATANEQITECNNYLASTLKNKNSGKIRRHYKKRKEYSLKILDQIAHPRASKINEATSNHFNAKHLLFHYLSSMMRRSAEHRIIKLITTNTPKKKRTMESKSLNATPKPVHDKKSAFKPWNIISCLEKWRTIESIVDAAPLESSLIKIGKIPLLFMLIGDHVRLTRRISEAAPRPVPRGDKRKRSKKPCKEGELLFSRLVLKLANGLLKNYDLPPPQQQEEQVNVEDLYSILQQPTRSVVYGNKKQNIALMPLQHSINPTMYKSKQLIMSAVSSTSTQYRICKKFLLLLSTCKDEQVFKALVPTIFNAAVITPSISEMITKHNKAMKIEIFKHLMIQGGVLAQINTWTSSQGFAQCSQQRKRKLAQDYRHGIFLAVVLSKNEALIKFVLENLVMVGGSLHEDLHAAYMDRTMQHPLFNLIKYHMNTLQKHAANAARVNEIEEEILKIAKLIAKTFNIQEYKCGVKQDTLLHLLCSKAVYSPSFIEKMIHLFVSNTNTLVSLTNEKGLTALDTCVMSSANKSPTRLAQVAKLLIQKYKFLAQSPKLTQQQTYLHVIANIVVHNGIVDSSTIEFVKFLAKHTSVSVSARSTGSNKKKNSTALEVLLCKLKDDKLTPAMKQLITLLVTKKCPVAPDVNMSPLVKSFYKECIVKAADAVPIVGASKPKNNTKGNAQAVQMQNKQNVAQKKPAFEIKEPSFD